MRNPKVEPLELRGQLQVHEASHVVVHERVRVRAAHRIEEERRLLVEQVVHARNDCYALVPVIRSTDIVVEDRRQTIAGHRAIRQRPDLIRREDPLSSEIVFGRYVDRLTCQAGEWGISARLVIMEGRMTVDNAQMSALPPYVHRSLEDASYRRPLDVTRLGGESR